MRLKHDPKWVATNHMVPASAIQNGSADLQSYPHTYLMIVGDGSGYGLAVLPHLLRAVEALVPQGWELVTINKMTDTYKVAVMRRHPGGG